MPPDDAEDAQAPRARFVERAHQVHAHAQLGVTAADGQDEDGVVPVGPADAEPLDEHRLPALVVDARGELGDVVDRGVGLDVTELPEVVDGVAAVRRAAAGPEKKQPASATPQLHEAVRDAIDRLVVESARDLTDLVEVGADVRRRLGVRILHDGKRLLHQDAPLFDRLTRLSTGPPRIPSAGRATRPP